MIYNEVGFGGVKTSGCAIVFVPHITYTAFGVGDILYNIHKARRGVLEKVVIKQIIPAKTILTNGLFVVLYKDTLNGLWNEYDLVTLADAKLIAETYYQNLLDDLAELEAQKKC
jgi:hypothetical protein